MSDKSSSPNTRKKKDSADKKGKYKLQITIRLLPEDEEVQIYFDYIDELVRRQEKIPSAADIGKFFMRQYPLVKELQKENEELKKRIEELEKDLAKK